MRKVYYLGTCDTCKRIMDAVNIEGFELQDIKQEPITEEQIEYMGSLAGSYEELFSRRARKFRAMGLQEQELTERDYRRLILEEYTFLKRPVFIIDEFIYIGNSKKTIAAIQDALA